MSKGAYLKENRDTRGNNPPIDHDEWSRRRKKRRRRKLQRRILLGVLAAVLALAGGMAWWANRSPILGSWQMDQVTSYEFYDSSNGALVLPSDSYAFTYKITGKTLEIDFAYEGAKDAVYVFTRQGDTLILEGGNATVQGTYTLTKAE